MCIIINLLQIYCWVLRWKNFEEAFGEVTPFWLPAANMALNDECEEKLHWYDSLSVQAGNYMRDDMISCLIQLVQETSNLHAYTVQQLYRAMSADISQQPLLQVAVWCIGEFGDQLFTATSDDDEPVQVCFPVFISLWMSVCVVRFMWSSENIGSYRSWKILESHGI